MLGALPPGRPRAGGADGTGALRHRSQATGAALCPGPGDPGGGGVGHAARDCFPHDTGTAAVLGSIAREGTALRPAPGLPRQGRTGTGTLLASLLAR
jgi:hypothetical protein